MARQAPEGQQRTRVFAQRGKSMEELGVPKLAKSCALSKSSEQLDYLWRRSGGPGVVIGPDREKRSVSVFGELQGAKFQGQEKERKCHWVSEKAGDRREMVGPKNVQGQMQNQSLFKQDSEPVLGSGEEAGPLTTEGTTNLCRSASPASFSRATARSGSAGSVGSVTDEVKPNRSPSDTSNPPPPRGQEASEREIKSTSSSPNQTMLPYEKRSNSR